MTYSLESGKTNQFLVILIAALLLLLIIFGLSKLIPRGTLQAPSLPSPAPSEASPESETPANTYTNSDYGFSFTLPQDWEAKENIASSLPHRLFFVSFAPKDQPDPSITIEVKDQPVDEIIKNFRAEVNQSSDNKITIQREVRLDKQYIKQITVRNSSSNADTYFRFAEKDARTYIISGEDTKLLDFFSFTAPTSSPQ